MEKNENKSFLAELSELRSGNYISEETYSSVKVGYNMMQTDKAAAENRLLEEKALKQPQAVTQSPAPNMGAPISNAPPVPMSFGAKRRQAEYNLAKQAPLPAVAVPPKPINAGSAKPQNTGFNSHFGAPNVNVITAPPVPKQKSAEESRNRRYTIMLTAGVIMVLIAGIMLATGTWEFMPDAVKVTTIMIVGALFLGVGVFAGKVLKIEKMGIAFWALGCLYVPVSMASVCGAGLLGELLSFSGAGRYVSAFGICVICLPLYIYSAIRYNSKVFAWISAFDISLTVLFALLMCGARGMVLEICLAVYCIALILVNLIKGYSLPHSFADDVKEKFPLVNLLVITIITTPVAMFDDLFVLFAIAYGIAFVSVYLAEKRRWSAVLGEAFICAGSLWHTAKMLITGGYSEQITSLIILAALFAAFALTAKIIKGKDEFLAKVTANTGYCFITVASLFVLFKQSSSSAVYIALALTAVTAAAAHVFISVDINKKPTAIASAIFSMFVLRSAVDFIQKSIEIALPTEEYLLSAQLSGIPFFNPISWFTAGAVLMLVGVTMKRAEDRREVFAPYWYTGLAAIFISAFGRTYTIGVTAVFSLLATLALIKAIIFTNDKIRSGKSPLSVIFTVGAVFTAINGACDLVSGFRELAYPPCVVALILLALAFFTKDAWHKIFKYVGYALGIITAFYISIWFGNPDVFTYISFAAVVLALLAAMWRFKDYLFEIAPMGAVLAASLAIADGSEHRFIVAAAAVSAALAAVAVTRCLIARKAETKRSFTATYYFSAVVFAFFAAVCGNTCTNIDSSYPHYVPGIIACALVVWLGGVILIKLISAGETQKRIAITASALCGVWAWFLAAEAMTFVSDLFIDELICLGVLAIASATALAVWREKPVVKNIILGVSQAAVILLLFIELIGVIFSQAFGSEPQNHADFTMFVMFGAAFAMLYVIFKQTAFYAGAITVFSLSYLSSNMLYNLPEFVTPLILVLLAGSIAVKLLNSETKRPRAVITWAVMPLVAAWHHTVASLEFVPDEYNAELFCVGALAAVAALAFAVWRDSTKAKNIIVACGAAVITLSLGFDMTNSAYTPIITILIPLLYAMAFTAIYILSKNPAGYISGIAMFACWALFGAGSGETDWFMGVMLILLALSVASRLFAGETNRRREVITFTAVPAVIAWHYFVTAINPPEIIKTELFLAVLTAVGILLAVKVWHDTAGETAFMISTLAIASLRLFTDVMRVDLNHLFTDGIIYTTACIGAIIAGVVFKRRASFIVGIVSLAASVIFQTFVLVSLSWTIYLFIAGIALIVCACIVEFIRRKKEAEADPADKKVKEWRI